MTVKLARKSRYGGRVATYSKIKSEIKLGFTLHDTVLKRYRVAAGSAQPIHDYLRPPRLPSLPRFFHPPRLFSIARPLLHPRFRYGNRYRNRTRRPLTRPTQLNARAAPNSTHRHLTSHSSATQLTTHRHHSNHQGFLRVAPPALTVARWTLAKIKRLLAVEFPLGRTENCIVRPPRRALR